MTKQNKAFKFRLYQIKKERVIVKTFGCVRFVYNKMLTERKETYEKFKDDKKQKSEASDTAKYKMNSIPKRSGFASFGERTNQLTKGL